MADRATGEFLVIAVQPEYEGRGVGGKLTDLAEGWLAASGCTRAWLSTDLDTTLRAYGLYRRLGWTDWNVALKAARDKSSNWRSHVVEGLPD